MPIAGVLNVGANYIHQPFQNNGPADISLDEGPCPADRRHLFNLTSVFRTPEFDGFLGALASNWTASSVLQVRSGGPVNVVAGGDPRSTASPTTHRRSGRTSSQALTHMVIATA